MGTLVSKGFRVLTTRPMQILAHVRSYALFLWARLWRGLVFGKSSGVTFGRNVRIQRLRTLNAERPNASIAVGDHTIVYENARIEAYGSGRITIGTHCVLGDVRIHAREKITIGARSIFAWNVFIQDYASHPVDPSERAKQIISMTEHMMPAFDGYKPTTAPYQTVFSSQAIEIGEDVWFGANCTILAGAKIGPGSIVGANAVVTPGEYPPGSILAGNPARVIETVPVNGA